MNETMVQQDFATNCQKVLQVAKELYQGNPDWVTFFREVLGVNGAARNVFPNQNDYVAFEKSPQHSEIQQMVMNLRHRKIPGGNHNEATRVITVRLPESLHEALKAEANDHKTSMNKLCISKLLQVLMDEPDGAVRRNSQPAASRPDSMVPTPAAPSQPASRPVSQPMSSPLSSNTDANRFRSQF